MDFSKLGGIRKKKSDQRNHWEVKKHAQSLTNTVRVSHGRYWPVNS